MRVEASSEAVRLVQEPGGKLYVWAERTRCCGGPLVFLETSAEPGERPFRRVASHGFELYLDERLGEPEELVVEARGWRSATCTRTGTAAPTSSSLEQRLVI